MKNPFLKLKLSHIFASAGMIAFVAILLFTVSCKKEIIEDEDNEIPVLPGSHPSAHVLKEPYLLYNNNPTSMVMALT